ncbi:F-box/kelch-repeat protein At3g23880-like [Lotus japonicus]|uniref:F-box/kelch-repeat protein At3g23880-like n=1 Tax=Lotus japonicus TaxID=34305 RepID=UPI0025881E26|nr:F-box/kelch-repeat protein At3g23880-like [Lotus japonicus]
MNKQKQRRSITNASLSSLLPDELIIQILLRLPVRSLLRFKCVCKLWLSEISDPKFAKSQFDLAASPTHRLFLDFNDQFEIESLDIDEPESAAAVVNIPFCPPLSSPCSGARFEILGSCRGFVLLVTHLGYFHVWNPSTGFQRQIPLDARCTFKVYYSLYGIGYDQSTDDYLLVYITPSKNVRACEINSFSLKTNLPSRKRISDEILDTKFAFSMSVRQGMFFNGCLHWLVNSRGKDLFVILAFDLSKRSLLEIAVSNELALELADVKKLYTLRVMKECLALCCSDLGGVTVIWIMKEYKVKSSWTKMILSADVPSSSFFFPICFTKCGDVFGWNERERLLRLNDKGELLEDRALWKGKRTQKRDFVIYRYPELHRHMYTESLLSLHG